MKERKSVSVRKKEGEREIRRRKDFTVKSYVNFIFTCLTRTTVKGWEFGRLLDKFLTALLPDDKLFGFVT